MLINDFAKNYLSITVCTINISLKIYIIRSWRVEKPTSHKLKIQFII